MFFGAPVVDVNILGIDGKRPLDLAAVRTDAKLAMLLLQHGADASNTSGDALLLWATEQKHTGLLALLLSQGADANANKGAPLWRAFQHHWQERSSLRFDVNIGQGSFREEQRKRIPYHEEIAWDSLGLRDSEEMIRILLKGGAKADNYCGTMLLAWAIERGDAELAALLLQRGANANSTTFNQAGTSLDATPLSRAEFLFNDYQRRKEGRELAILLLRYGAAANTETGRSLLFQATSFGDVELTTLLLERGVIKNDKSDHSPMLILRDDTHGYDEKIAVLLLRHGANVNSEEGAKLLLWGAIENHRELVDLLRHGEVDIDRLNAGKNASLLLDFARCHNGCAELILKTHRESVLRGLVGLLENEDYNICLRAAEVLAAFGDLRSLEPLLRLSATRGEQIQTKFSSANSGLDESINDYVGLFNACRQHTRTSHGTPGNESYSYSLDSAEAAVQQLARIRTRVSDNLLCLLVQLKDISVAVNDPVCEIACSYGTVSFASIRKKAEEELKKRGRPKYDPTAFVEEKAWGLRPT
jgi:ankyrin repeat protein